MPVQILTSCLCVCSCKIRAVSREGGSGSDLLLSLDVWSLLVRSKWMDPTHTHTHTHTETRRVHQQGKGFSLWSFLFRPVDFVFEAPGGAAGWLAGQHSASSSHTVNTSFLPWSLQFRNKVRILRCVCVSAFLVKSSLNVNFFLTKFQRYSWNFAFYVNFIH